MGNLTEGMSRLCGEITALHDARHTLTKERKQAVADARAGFRTAFTDMARKARGERFARVSGIRTRVAGLRQVFAGDIDGAHRAWFGKNG